MMNSHYDPQVDFILLLKAAEITLVPLQGCPSDKRPFFLFGVNKKSMN